MSPELQITKSFRNKAWDEITGQQMGKQRSRCNVLVHAVNVHNNQACGGWCKSQSELTYAWSTPTTPSPHVMFLESAVTGTSATQPATTTITRTKGVAIIHRGSRSAQCSWVVSTTVDGGQCDLRCTRIRARSLGLSCLCCLVGRC